MYMLPQEVIQGLMRGPVVECSVSSSTLRKPFLQPSFATQITISLVKECGPLSERRRKHRTLNYGTNFFGNGHEVMLFEARMHLQQQVVLMRTNPMALHLCCSKHSTPQVDFWIMRCSLPNFLALTMSLTYPLHESLVP